MNGAECLLRTLIANGVDTCFMNPGTSEMQFVSALDRVPAMRSLLCLFEGVCSGAADGYARMLRRPAATLLHLGPGLGNGLANFHNARKARSPVVSIVGQHTTQHLRHDAPLSADIEAFARTVSGHVRTVERAEEIGREAAATVAAACTPPGQVATLIVPADFSWSEAGQPSGPAPRATYTAPDPTVSARPPCFCVPANRWACCSAAALCLPQVSNWPANWPPLPACACLPAATAPAWPAEPDDSLRCACPISRRP